MKFLFYKRELYVCKDKRWIFGYKIVWSWVFEYLEFIDSKGLVNMDWFLF